MEWRDLTRVMAGLMLIALVASCFVPSWRVACGLLYLGMATAGVADHLFDAVDNGRTAPIVKPVGLVVFTSIGFLMLIWGTGTTDSRRT